MKKLLLQVLGLVCIMSSPLGGMTKKASLGSMTKKASLRKSAFENDPLRTASVPTDLTMAAKILGIKRTDKSTVEKAYRILMKKYHPNFNTDKSDSDQLIATAISAKINAANDLFKNHFQAIADAVIAEKEKKEQEAKLKRAQARAGQSPQAKPEEAVLKEVIKAQMAARTAIDAFIKKQEKVLTLNKNLAAFLKKTDINTETAKAGLVNAFKNDNVAFQVFVGCDGCGISLSKMKVDELQKLTQDVINKQLDLKNPEKFARQIREYVNLSY